MDRSKLEIPCCEAYSRPSLVRFREMDVPQYRSPLSDWVGGCFKEMVSRSVKVGIAKRHFDECFAQFRVEGTQRYFSKTDEELYDSPSAPVQPVRVGFSPLMKDA